MREPIKQGPDLDLELRKTYIGSSEWAVVAGIFNQYKSPLGVYTDKINGYESFMPENRYFLGLEILIRRQLPIARGPKFPYFGQTL